MTIHIRHLYNDTAQTPLARREGQRMLNRYTNNEDSAENHSSNFCMTSSSVFFAKFTAGNVQNN